MSESIPALPGDDEREAWEQYAKAEGLVWDMPNSSERRAFAAGFRRLSPLTQEALEPVVAEAIAGAVDLAQVDAGAGPMNAAYWKSRIAKLAVKAVLSRFSLPEPAEVEWEYGRRNRMTGGVRPLKGPPLPSWWNESQDQWEHVKSPKYPERVWVPVKGTEQP